MSFAVCPLLLVVTLTSSLPLAQTAVLNFNETCLFNWIVQSGVQPVHAIRIEWKLRQAAMNESTIRHLSPSILALIVGDAAVATNLKACIGGSKKDCVWYNPCEAGGVCSFSAERKKNVCQCRRGLHGDLCKEDCNECSSDCALEYSCPKLAACVNTHGSYRCECKKGFAGNRSLCEDINECQLGLCSPNATCVNLIGSFYCYCNVGYTGNGSMCTDVCECCSNPCQNGGKCVEQVNGYTCKCSIGFDGDLCETRWLNDLEHKLLPMEVKEIEESLFNLTHEIAELHKTVVSNAEDDCKMNPCENGGRCIDQHNSFVCICADGFHGPNCSAEEKGLIKDDPASSCQDVYSVGQSDSGIYWIKSAQGEAVQVYCDMSAGGGWMRVAEIDAKRHGCPGNLQFISAAGGRITVCALKSGFGCSSTKFSTHNVPYSKVRGFAYGHQYHTPDAFYGGGSIDSHYVEGVSITHGSPREHIWTFAVGLTQDERSHNSRYNCPCAQYPGPSPPSFVGKDYYCESGAQHCCTIEWFSERLWDGSCHSKSKCCNHSGMPFFVKDLKRLVTDPLEVRLCLDQSTDNENVGVEKLELFVR